MDASNMGRTLCLPVCPAQQVPSQRYRLAMLPTPIHEWRLPGLPEGVRMLIKRDDLSGMQASGNKV